MCPKSIAVGAWAIVSPRLTQSACVALTAVASATVNATLRVKDVVAANPSDARLYSIDFPPTTPRYQVNPTDPNRLLIATTNVDAMNRRPLLVDGVGHQPPQCMPRLPRGVPRRSPHLTDRQRRHSRCTA